MSRIRSPNGLRDLQKRRLADILDLTRLSIGLRHSLAILLLLPLGALLTCAFRSLVGLQTFGTFTPSLLALSFVYSDWRNSALLLVTVLAVGFMSRSGLEKLKLLMVPRLSTILTLVVLCMVFGASALAHWGREMSDGTALVPLVVLTMLIERFHVSEQEDGIGFALTLLCQTLLVAACCYALLSSEALGRLLLTYPELHCVTLGALIWVGRYAGYRVTELWRFRDLVT